MEYKKVNENLLRKFAEMFMVRHNEYAKLKGTNPSNVELEINQFEMMDREVVVRLCIDGKIIYERNTKPIGYTIEESAEHLCGMMLNDIFTFGFNSAWKFIQERDSKNFTP